MSMYHLLNKIARDQRPLRVLVRWPDDSFPVPELASGTQMVIDSGHDYEAQPGWFDVARLGGGDLISTGREREAAGTPWRYYMRLRVQAAFVFLAAVDRIGSDDIDVALLWKHLDDEPEGLLLPGAKISFDEFEIKAPDEVSAHVKVHVGRSVMVLT